jgi:hypothetical protein
MWKFGDFLIRHTTSCRSIHVIAAHTAAGCDVIRVSLVSIAMTKAFALIAADVADASSR